MKSTNFMSPEIAIYTVVILYNAHPCTHSHLGILDKMHHQQSSIDALHGQMTSQLNIDPEVLSGVSCVVYVLILVVTCALFLLLQFISCKQTACPNYDCDDTSVSCCHGYHHLNLFCICVQVSQCHLAFLFVAFVRAAQFFRRYQ